VSTPLSADGQVPSWEEVARSHGRFLYTLAYRLTGDHDDAQDLVQEVLLRVRRGLTTYQAGSLEGWLSRITTNAFLDEMRRRRRRPVHPVPDLSEHATAVDPDPEAELARVHLPDELQQALAELPPDYRTAVVLSDVVGYGYAEIADALGIPLGTVRSRIHRGRAALREKLA